MKISFKKEPAERGLSSVGNPHPDTLIKVDKKEVGTISGPSWRSNDHKWVINLRIIDPNDPEKKKWKNVLLKARFDTEDEARLWLKANLEKISLVHTLVPFEE